MLCTKGGNWGNLHDICSEGMFTSPTHTLWRTPPSRRN